jgi:hypothetical protein
VEGTACNIIILEKGKHLRFIGIAVVIRVMKDFFYVTDVARTPYFGAVTVIVPPYDLF